MKRTTILLLTCFISLATMAQTAKHTFAIGEADFLLDGKRLQIRCGELHAARVPQAYWRHRLKMCKALGLNTVCAYLFWNQHEPREGQFDFTGQADAALFCKIAQEEGLWVILRPGPYSCAEWEMGGTPWWLLKDPTINMRTRDPKYMEPAKRYLKKVGEQLAPLQITRGGPILMVQVENEYGFFGDDTEYMGDLMKAIKEAGFDVPLFGCNPTYRLKHGYRSDLFQVVNFGSNVEAGFKALRELQPKGPLMCGEFYPAWFDTWGNPHHVGNMENYISDLNKMLSLNGSFSIYMAHGGTTFGFWPGCDRPFKPDVSSYDYEAPISEAGWTTEKFRRTRDLLSKYLLPGESIPEPPPPNPVMDFAALKPVGTASLFDILPKPLRDEAPKNFEAYDHGFGCILYRTTLPAGAASTLSAADVRDFGYVYLDNTYIGAFDRRRPKATVKIPARSQPARLDILLEPMGRVNFGKEMADRKGLHAPVRLGDAELKGWQIYKLPLTDCNTFAYGKTITAPQKLPTFYRFTLTCDNPADTFLDLRNWRKGMVFVNGIALCRYWSIGPTQTAYLPGCWLKKGDNEIIVWEIIGTEGEPTLTGLKTPILNEMRPETDFNKVNRPKTTWLNTTKPAKAGQFPKGHVPQEITLDTPAIGRFVAFESLNAWDNKAYAAIAELDFYDANKKVISHDGWVVAHVTSEERGSEDGSAENAIDGQTANLWHTEWQKQSPGHPHRLVLDLGKQQTITGFRYVPRQSEGGGRIKDYNFYVGDKLIE